ncbi:transcript variant X2 [Nothobranchius furzeri]|uniref:Transcript variant X2 n=1 Tax=Nothobranchius furzeri TaxID=105023 RepID=A0A9D2YUR9_NOTFU|nr:transcript variant X2 [Nothobranchius furzeri]
MKGSDLEGRFASLLCLAFKDCTGLESAIKMLTVVAPFLKRKRVGQIFSPSFLLLQQLLREDLENCKCLFKSQLNQTKSYLIRSMAHTSGALKWAKMLREHIQTPWDKLKLLFDMPVTGVEMESEHSMCMEMLSLLDQYEEDIYSEWCKGLEQDCLINLSQPLISRSSSSGLISVNFNPKVTDTVSQKKLFWSVYFLFTV